jgi:glutamyl-tRNA reductase
MVIGISLRSAKLAMRERFVLNPAQNSSALSALVRSDAIDEVIVFSNCNRTEFIVWTNDVSEAANSVLRYLSHSSNLKLAEWSNYYRLVGDAAVAHVLRVTAGTDSPVFGESEATNSVLGAWQLAQRHSATGRFLDAVMAKAFAVAGRVHQELGAASSMATVAEAAVAACRESLVDMSPRDITQGDLSQGNLSQGNLKERRVLVLGAGQMALSVIRELQSAGAGEITVVNRSWEHAQQLARQRNVKAVHAENLWEQVLRADVVISAASQKVMVTREELEVLLPERNAKQLVMVDIAVPRSIDPNVRELTGVNLHDLDDLCAAMDKVEHRRAALPSAERIVAEEAAGFRNKLVSEAILPSISAMRERLEIICGQEMDQLREQFGPFTEDQELALGALSSHIAQRISSTLARQLKEIPGHPELTSAIHQLFQLELLTSKTASQSFD